MKSSLRPLKQPITPEELGALRRAAWQKQGIPSFDLSDVSDDWTRQIIINEAERLYGKRQQTQGPEASAGTERQPGPAGQTQIEG